MLPKEEKTLELYNKKADFNVYAKLKPILHRTITKEQTNKSWNK